VQSVCAKLQQAVPQKEQGEGQRVRPKATRDTGAKALHEDPATQTPGTPEATTDHHTQTQGTMMKTLEQVVKLYKSDTLDGRDVSRLAAFTPADKLAELGFELKEGSTHTPIPLTRENVLKQLAEDVDFGFEKALDKRGISAGLMFSVVKMWNWILEEGLENWSDDNYAHYGLPLFKATAIKYGLKDEISGKTGTEAEFSTYG
jgi:hypothetical protein